MKESTMNTTLDAKYMALVLTQEGFMRWAEGRSINVTDVKSEFRDAFLGNFITKK